MKQNCLLLCLSLVIQGYSNLALAADDKCSPIFPGPPTEEHTLLSRSPGVATRDGQELTITARNGNRVQFIDKSDFSPPECDKNVAFRFKGLASNFALIEAWHHDGFDVYFVHTASGQSHRAIAWPVASPEAETFAALAISFGQSDARLQIFSHLPDDSFQDQLYTHIEGVYEVRIEYWDGGDRLVLSYCDPKHWNEGRRIAVAERESKNGNWRVRMTGVSQNLVHFIQYVCSERNGE